MSSSLITQAHLELLVRISKARGRWPGSVATEHGVERFGAAAATSNEAKLKDLESLQCIELHMIGSIGQIKWAAARLTPHGRQMLKVRVAEPTNPAASTVENRGAEPALNPTSNTVENHGEPSTVRLTPFAAWWEKYGPLRSALLLLPFLWFVLIDKHLVLTPYGLIVVVNAALMLYRWWLAQKEVIPPRPQGSWPHFVRRVSSTLETASFVAFLGLVMLVTTVKYGADWRVPAPAWLTAFYGLPSR